MENMEAASSVGDAALKRPCSPIDRSVTEPATKRACLSGGDTTCATEPPPKRCLYCDSTEHTWFDCSEYCKNCQTRHAQHRCDKLDVGHYLPGPFSALPSTVSNIAPPENSLEPKKATRELQSAQSAMVIDRQPAKTGPPMDGVSSERLAMIAATPAEESRSFSQGCVPLDGCGPLQSGMNSLPLGSRPSLLSQSPRDSTSSSSSVGSQHSEHLMTLRAKVEATRPSGYAPTVPHPADRLLGFNASSLGPPPPNSTAYGRLNGSLRGGPPPIGPPRRSFAPPAAPRKKQVVDPSARDIPQPVTIQTVLNMTPGAIEHAEKFRQGVRGAQQNVLQYGAENMGIWTDITAHIQQVIQGAVDPNRAKNNGFDDKDVGKALQKINDTLRPLILRDKRTSSILKQKESKNGFTRVMVTGDAMDLDEYKSDVSIKRE
ncbi:hypothetical protein Slin15195_G046090 [Septoria linicola]|uniref:Uncharacterized protein n=1 Tax=Septoria linicola TaxID=215465 RepID=A0A9Q9ALP8_9PEZI|nr:hypothetical protein Slin14017_G049620 [Septoria linicola]USW51290.1 hypothetical protein Slin15195_G046090 [Septoria linicola]